MSDFTEIIENSVLGKTLACRCKEGNLSHAYLFVSGDEKYLMAFCDWFASLVLGNRVKVESRTHADLFVIDESKIISVESVVPIVSDVYVAPFEADYKVYIIKDASAMTDEAQNKILKTLEEPPENVIIVLASSTDNSLLPTILSRVSRFDLEPLTDKQLMGLLTKNGVSEKEASIVASCSGGNFTHALNLSGDTNFIELYDLVLEMFWSLKGSRDILKFESKINLQKISLFEFFDLTISVARDIMALQANKPELILNKSKVSELKKCLDGFNYSSLTRIIALAIEARKDLTFNANSVAVLDEFLLKMVEAKVTCKK